ncbi:MAG: 2-amino-4-hydroxy-6-hydroxymethyldihydropteridine diphosphokinase [Armatimonadetes bacterium]|nr:2-amino-4-hydroxy-6-hydroxymethyldihydropteridine diphosphokinase [Armatimonadota bacterium]
MLAYLGLGSNVGDRLAYLQTAVNLLDMRAGEVRRISRVFETAPMYIEDQPPFLNAAVEIETRFEPTALLRAVKEIEEEIGRIVRERNAPREIDIDLLLMLNGLGAPPLTFADAELTVPHPRLGDRRFALEPLADLAAGLMLDGETVGAALSRDDIQKQDVKPLKDAVLSIHRD